MMNANTTTLFNGLVEVNDINGLKDAIAKGERSALLNGIVITAVAVSDSAALLYYNAYPNCTLHDGALHFAGVLLKDTFYAKSGIAHFNDFHPQSFEVAMAKTRIDVVKAINELYNAAEISADAFASYELPLAKMTAKQILTGKLDANARFEPRLSEDEILPVFLGLISATDAAAEHSGANGEYYAWRKAQLAKALELIEKREAASDMWYKIYDAVAATDAVLFNIVVAHNGREVASKITRGTILDLLSEGENAVINANHFFSSLGIDVMKQLYGCLYDNQSSLALANIVSITR